jgi:glycosyltransferase involved in cell wall biosynthesis
VKILVSLLAFRPGRVGGAETYLRQLLAHLPDAAGPDRVAAVMDRDVAAALDTPGIERVVVDRSAREIVLLRGLEAFTPYRARDIERAFAATGADVAFFPQQSLFPKRPVLPSAVMVHDVQHLFHPERFPLLDRAFRAAIYPRALAAARLVLVNSEYTRHTLVERCAVPAEKIVVTPLGYTPVDPARVTPYRGIARTYLYYPAATYPHKNHQTLLRSYAALRRSGAIADRLVLTGERTGDWKRLQRLAADLGIAADVVHLGFVSRDEVLALYAGARAVVFPSLFEGFGLPAVEAAQLGKKVITSRLPIFDELGVPRAWQIDFADPAQLRSALELDGPTRLERGPLVWSATARATVRALETLLSSPGDLREPSPRPAAARPARPAPR